MTTRAWPSRWSCPLASTLSRASPTRRPRWSTCRSLPEVDGGTGVLGFCLGGSIAYFLAAQGGLDAAVSFYGSAVPGNLDALDRIGIPLQLHFGGSDPYIPRDLVARVEAAAATHAHVELHVEEDAGHAFHNRKAPMFYVPAPAARAWRRAEEFLQRHLPVREKAPPAR
jgi:carboxymethylenebutenolidase